jgi:diguanylate cyclase (GGDEF)-like protein
MVGKDSSRVDNVAMLSAEHHSAAHSGRMLLGALLGIAFIAWVDYATGTELRVFPLYFLPLSLAAWQGGSMMAGVAAGLCTLGWVGSNYAAGMRLALDFTSTFNTLAQFAAFMTVGQLIAAQRLRILHEAWSARHDALTGLDNVRGFMLKAEGEVERARRYSRRLTVAYLDLDGFKAVNDQWGHPRGDDVLRAVATTLKGSIRTVDVLARLGGDEFGLILPETDEAGARALLGRLREAVVARMQEEQLDVTVSIGATTYAVSPPDVKTMLKQADAQMYLVKQSGKNRVVVSSLHAYPSSPAATALGTEEPSPPGEPEEVPAKLTAHSEHRSLRGGAH